MKEDTDVLARIQRESTKVDDLLEEARRRLQVQLEAFPADVEDVSHEMADWDECPTPKFFVHGLLCLALDHLAASRRELQEAADASPESIRQEWLRHKRRR
jgi:hypothetical protein